MGICVAIMKEFEESSYSCAAQLMYTVWTGGALQCDCECVFLLECQHMHI